MLLSIVLSWIYQAPALAAIPALAAPIGHFLNCYWFGHYQWFWQWNWGHWIAVYVCDP